MKKLLLSAVAILMAATTYGQGHLTFDNIAFDNPGTPGVDEGVDAPVFNVDGVTMLDGSQFMSQLYAGASADSLAAVGAAVPFSSGAAAGYYFGSTRVIPGIAGGQTAFIQTRVWDTTTGATWEDASIRGELASPLELQLTETPTPPVNMVGLTSFSLVPEPSTIALAILGAGALAFASRRRK